MSCKTETKEINDHEYSVTQWPAEKAMLNKMKLIKCFGASFALIAAGNDDVKVLSDAVAVTFNTSSPEEIVSLIKNCVVGVSRDSKKITETSFTELFSGDDLADIYSVFFFVISVNYSNLFKGRFGETILARVSK